MKDAWGRTIEYVRLSLTDACNFCCPYCRPAEITPQSQTQLLSVDEWMTILGAFHRIGVKAVRLTGGEPLLYPHIEELLTRIKDTGWFEDISMTT
ncbi:MAG: radical SAM protein, partial [Veillonella sp.]|nr:radical SAM protein [Veillonella sp.]